jgi:hypothetical protein
MDAPIIPHYDLSVFVLAAIVLLQTIVCLVVVRRLVSTEQRIESLTALVADFGIKKYIHAPSDSPGFAESRVSSTARAGAQFGESA